MSVQPLFAGAASSSLRYARIIEMVTGYEMRIPVLDFKPLRKAEELAIPDRIVPRKYVHLKLDHSRFVAVANKKPTDDEMKQVCEIIAIQLNLLGVSFVNKGTIIGLKIVHGDWAGGTETRVFWAWALEKDAA